MIIIFDFDHTLFSAKKLYLAFQKTFEKLGVDEKLFQETFQKSKGHGRDYNPERQFKLIKREKPEISLKEQKRTFNKILNQAEKFVYPEVLTILNEFQKRGYELFVLTYGEGSFQPRKVDRSKIGKFFKKILITRDIKKVSDFRKFFKKDEKTVFVEDNPNVLLSIKTAFPEVITVRINRGEGKYALEKNNKGIDFSIKNMVKLKRLIKKP